MALTRCFLDLVPEDATETHLLLDEHRGQDVWRVGVANPSGRVTVLNTFTDETLALRTRDDLRDAFGWPS